MQRQLPEEDRSFIASQPLVRKVSFMKCAHSLGKNVSQEEGPRRKGMSRERESGNGSSASKSLVLKHPHCFETWCRFVVFIAESVNVLRKECTGLSMQFL